MKFIFLLLGTISLLSPPASACSTFFLNTNGEMLFGRNYDWVTDIGIVNTNLKGLSKTSLSPEPGKTISWVSRYGSITFNQYGKEFPNGGMNEKGLVIELMWLSESEFPAPDQRPAMNVLQWIQYQLDNAASVSEVIASDQRLRINADGTPQHYLVADAQGAVATIEFLHGKMEVHTGHDLPFPVLTNSTYSKSVQSLRPAANAGKNTRTPPDNSLQRFAKACSMIQEYHEGMVKIPAADYAFDILQKVSQGDFTKWSIVYDVKNRKIYFRTQAYQQVKHVNMKAFDFACMARALSFNMNQDGAGDITARFTAFSPEQNGKWVREAIGKSRSEFSIPAGAVDAAVRYPHSIRCR